MWTFTVTNVEALNQTCFLTGSNAEFHRWPESNRTLADADERP